MAKRVKSLLCSIRECCQQGFDSYLLLKAVEAIYGVLYPVLGSTVEKRKGHAAPGLVSGHEDD